MVESPPAPPLYVGSGRTISENFTVLSVDITKCEEQDLFSEFNGRKYLRIKVNKRKQPDNYGKDLSVSYDKYIPSDKVQKTG